MLFLVSGTSRSGKTLIARKILADKKIPYLSLDWLMMGFNDGIPEYGIHHLLWPNEIAEKMEPFLRGMIDNMLVDGMDYVIEGEAMLPQVKRHDAGDNDWLTRKSDEYIKDHIGNMIAYSKMIKAECEEHGLSYVDTSGDFPGAIAAATDVLVDDWSN